LTAAESVRIYSEFRRVDTAGALVPADTGGRPREILSPAIPLHAFSSFQLAVNVPPGKRFTLYIAQNPENTFQTTLYREIHEDGIPDRLEPAALPVDTTAKDRVQVYWLDLWTPLQTPPTRIRVEAQLHVDGHWSIFPMEVRVMKLVVPPVEAAGAVLPPITAPADASAHGPWKAAICGVREDPAAAGGPLTVRSLIRRNALQDVALARGRGSLEGDWRAIWCGESVDRGDAGPEWYLSLRGRLFAAK
jgi:hypothetical protein